MISLHSLLLAAAALAMLPLRAAAQDPDTVIVRVTGTAAAPELKVPESFRADGVTENPYSAAGRFFDFKCDAALDCTAIKATVRSGTSEPKPLIPVSKTKERSVFFLDNVPGIRDLTLAYEAAGRTIVTLTAKMGAKDPLKVDRPGVRIEPKCLTDIPLAPAKGKEAGFAPHFRVTYLGNVLHRPNYAIDERDQVLVTVLIDQERLSRLRVSRKSAFRSVGTINIMGAGTAIEIEKHAGTEVVLTCETYQLGDFASGRGEVEIEEVKNDAAVSLGSFDFAVEPLYSGAFSLGVARTPLLDPDIGLAFNGTDSVITAKTDGVESRDKHAHRILYALYYTHYIWGRRNVEKHHPWYQHINPTLGLVLNNVTTNFLAGATVDLFDGVFITGGAHAGKVRTIDPRSGLDFGKPFDGPSSAIPIVTRWRTRFFVGVAIDLRAGAAFFKTALGS